MEIVTFEIAKKLKGKSFPQKTAGRYSMIDCFYYEDGRLFFHGGACDVNEAYTAPTISQVLKWLRERDIMVEIIPSLVDDGTWTFSFRIQTKKFYDRSTKDYNSYELAALACIEYVLDNLI